MADTRAPLPEGVTCRAPVAGDFSKGHMELLAQLTVPGDVTAEQYAEALAEMCARGTHVLVLEDTSAQRIIGSASLVVERKLIRGCSLVGHVEDVVVDTAYRGKRLGEYLIRALCHVAKEHSCYKVILDCAEGNVAFYERCGFIRKEVQMRFDT